MHAHVDALARWRVEFFLPLSHCSMFLFLQRRTCSHHTQNLLQVFPPHLLSVQYFHMRACACVRSYLRGGIVLGRGVVVRGW